MISEELSFIKSKPFLISDVRNILFGEEPPENLAISREELTRLISSKFNIISNPTEKYIRGIDEDKCLIGVKYENSSNLSIGWSSNPVTINKINVTSNYFDEKSGVNFSNDRITYYSISLIEVETLDKLVTIITTKGDENNVVVCFDILDKNLNTNKYYKINKAIDSPSLFGIVIKSSQSLEDNSERLSLDISRCGSDINTLQRHARNVETSETSIIRIFKNEVSNIRNSIEVELSLSFGGFSLDDTSLINKEEYTGYYNRLPWLIGSEYSEQDADERPFVTYNRDYENNPPFVNSIQDKSHITYADPTKTKRYSFSTFRLVYNGYGLTEKHRILLNGFMTDRFKVSITDLKYGLMNQGDSSYCTVHTSFVKFARFEIIEKSTKIKTVFEIDRSISNSDYSVMGVIRRIVTNKSNITVDIMEEMYVSRENYRSIHQPKNEAGILKGRETYHLELYGDGTDYTDKFFGYIESNSLGSPLYGWDGPLGRYVVGNRKIQYITLNNAYSFRDDYTSYMSDHITNVRFINVLDRPVDSIEEFYSNYISSKPFENLNTEKAIEYDEKIKMINNALEI